MPAADDASSLPTLAPHAFWQTVAPPGSYPQPDGGWRDIYPAALPDGREIALPIRVLPDGSGAVASLIVNQAAFVVEDALATVMAGQARALSPDLVVGMPTLGLGLAAQVARRLGHARMLPLGTSRKFWYDAALSVDLRSITSPGQDGGKRLYLDPRMVPLLRAARRVVVVDDVVSSGASLRSALGLLGMVDVVPVGAVFAMLQGRRWQAEAGGIAVFGAIATPRLCKGPGGGWLPEP